MPKNARTGIASQIIGSFEDIGEKVVSEVAKVPADIAGKALESLGASSGKKRKGPGLAGSAKQKSGAETSRNVRGD